MLDARGPAQGLINHVQLVPARHHRTRLIDVGAKETRTLTIQSNQIFAFAANKKGPDTQISEPLLINYLHIVGVAEGTRTPDIWNHNPVL